MALIEKLTQEQEEELIRFRQRYLAYGRSTEPADKPRAEAVIAGLYKEFGINLPRFEWVDSPMAMLQRMERMKNIRRNKLLDNIIDNIIDNHWNNLWYNIRDNLWYNLRDNLRNNLWNNLQNNLWNNLKDNLQNNLWNNFHSFYGGAHELYIWAPYRFALDIGVPARDRDKRRLQYCLDIGESALWWWPFEKVCVISDRPRICSVDNQGRLHSETGMAMAFRDGYGFWSWHGVRVPQHVIEMPHTITVTQALEEKNTDIRRVMFTRIGGTRLLEEMPKITVDKDRDVSGNPRELFEIKGINDRRFVALTDFSGAYYPASPVPPTVNTCAEAVAWRHRYIEIDPVTGNRTRANWLYDSPQQAG